MTRSIRRHRLDGGFVAGAEALLFGVLVCVVGTLILANAWRVVDARFAASAAAREAVRAAVETPLEAGERAMQVRATGAATQAIAAHGYTVQQLLVVPDDPLVLRRCAPVRITVTIHVDATKLPWFTSRSSYEVAATHEAVIEPLRTGLAAAGEQPCGF